MYQEQLSNPQHCHLMTERGELFKHKDFYEVGRDLQGPIFEKNPFGGQPLRFTRLAASRFLARPEYKGWTIKEIDNGQ